METQNANAIDTILAALPLESYRAGDTVLKAGSKTGRLFVLKQGAIAVFVDDVEIARVEEPRAIFGELSALLDEPHTADVRTLKDSQFYVADAMALAKNPTMMFHVARILGRRLVVANTGLVELKKGLHAGQPPGVLRKMVDNIQRMLSVGGSSFEQ